MLRIIIVISALLTLLSGCATTPTTTLDTSPNFKPAQAAQAHPLEMYLHSGRLLRSGDMDEAAFWFYAGQLRYRVHLMARPNLPPDQDLALFSSLNSTLGQEVNEYIGGNPSEWEQVIENVLSWDDQTPNDFTPKDKFPSAHREVRAGLLELKEMIHKNHQEIREDRASAGLENR
ncbi:hypothetical protein [Halopseudomonas salina]|uniref:Uncharacterized protein n=1 Tax=Halopseudomonas salina TaxID=1323744 RepID=A0ABQ1Q4H3_9GAMM|nr:hypothetical protein [Halopseudomonas salina]GGD12734.1 hypothetical protein GCM10007418_34510 [Halopseudomonas salina]